MNRLALLIACLGLSAAGTALAEEPAFCKSMCASEQRTCRAGVRIDPRYHRSDNFKNSDRNPFARTANGEVAGPATRALDAAGTNDRQSKQLGACDATYQRCTRACAIPPKSEDKDERAG